ncbi:MAG: hypothetical protein GY870_17030 [archaeon]|nr:hypothetical protein [archaeon]
MAEEPNYFRWYCKLCKKSVMYEYTEEFKEDLIKKAKGMFPYPIILKHNNHFSIVQLDKQMRDRGTLGTEILINLDKK